MTTQIIIAVPILVLLGGLRIAQEYQRGVVFRLGRFAGLRGPVLQERGKINGLLRLMIPSDFVTAAKSCSQYLSEHPSRKSESPP